jgi:hypothetical protein
MSERVDVNDAWGWRAEMAGWRDMVEPFPAPEGMTLRWRDREDGDMVAVAAEKRDEYARLFRLHLFVSREFMRTPHCPAHIEAQVDYVMRKEPTP